MSAGATNIKYGLTTLAIGRFPFLELSKTRFDELKRYRLISWEVVVFEQSFDLLVENYIEVEQELLNLSLNQMAFPLSLTWSSGTKDRYTINRRLINFLATARMYLDHTKSRSKLFQLPGFDKKSVLSMINQEQCDSFSYRFMDFLRNHALHACMPVHGVIYNSERTAPPRESGSKTESRITPYLQVDQFSASRESEISTLEELKKIGPRISLVPVLRQHMDSLARIHDRVRSAIKPVADEADSSLSKAVAEYQALGSEAGTVGLGLIAKRGSKHVETYSIFDEGIKHREWLCRKNAFFKHTSRHYVSGAASDDLKVE